MKNKNYQRMDFKEGTSKIERLISQLGAFIFSNIKRTKNHFIKLLDRTRTNSVYYIDTVSFYIEKKHSEKMKQVMLERI